MKKSKRRKLVEEKEDFEGALEQNLRSIGRCCG